MVARSNIPALDAVDAYIDPPQARHGHDEPQGGLPAEGAHGQPGEEQEVRGRDAEQDGDADGEEEDVERQVDTRRLDGHREEGRDAGAWQNGRSRVSSLSAVLARPGRCYAGLLPLSRYCEYFSMTAFALRVTCAGRAENVPQLLHAVAHHDREWCEFNV